MAKYTMEVRTICESTLGLTNGADGTMVDEIIERSRGSIFNFSYPIYDVAYRRVLETKILMHYYTREIGFETVGLWKLKLKTKLNEIMPYYNKLYESTLMKFNPLYTSDLTRTHTRTGTEKRENKNNSNTNLDISYSDFDLHSDTPQGTLDGVEEGNYLSDARHTNGISKNNTKVDSNGNENINSTEDYIEKVQGYEGRSAGKLLKEYRDSLINVDLMIIEELEELFMHLW